MSYLELKGITKKFGEFTAVQDMNLMVEKGEFVALLGESGCGKTTTLRMLAGFLEPTAGTIAIKEKEINDVPTHKRNIGIVFQDYALFPHMTVFDNISFGLKLQKQNDESIKENVARVLSMVKLDGLEMRFPRELSGGQQQRVAVARALIMEPDVLLLDEPLSNLDAKLREEMQVEIRSIQQSIGITTILVTHDQSEAMSLADRIVIMRAGEIQQIGTPKQVFEEPSSGFIADFMGYTNFFNGEIESIDQEAGVYTINASGNRILSKYSGSPDCSEGDSVQISIRPENIRIRESKDIDVENTYVAGIKNISYKGSTTRVVTENFMGADLCIDIADFSEKNIGNDIVIEMPPKNIKFFKK
jgi:spermidine/putrescine ABC transporter ATP-binding subunit